MKHNEQGRSMIEMLGVLAIIGVLSVGGLAGYAKAMGKYKLNKTVDQITQIVAGTRNLFAGHGDYKALGIEKECKTNENNGNLIIKGNLLPEAMISKRKAEDFQTENAYGGNVYLSCGDKRNSGDGKAFVIILENVSVDACMELATQNWGGKNSSGFVGLCVAPKGSQNTELGDVTLSSAGNNCFQEQVSLATATTACGGEDGKATHASMKWKFY